MLLLLAITSRASCAEFPAGSILLCAIRGLAKPDATMTLGGGGFGKKISRRKKCKGSFEGQSANVLQTDSRREDQRAWRRNFSERKKENEGPKRWKRRMDSFRD